MAEHQFRFRYQVIGDWTHAVIICGKGKVSFGQRGEIKMLNEEWTDFMNKLKRSGHFQFIERKE